MATILVDARCIQSQPAGVARYAIELVKALSSHHHHRWLILRATSNQENYFEGLRVEEFWDDCPHDNFHHIRGGHQAVHQLTLDQNIDLFHSLFHLLPSRLEQTLPTVVTLHDLIWLEDPDRSQGSFVRARSIELLARLGIVPSLKRADAIITVSEATRQRSLAWVGKPESTHVVEHGVHERFFGPVKPDAIVAGLRRGGRPYLVTIANDKPYKNIELLIRSWAMMDNRQNARMVLIGRYPRLRRLIKELGVSDSVMETGFLEDDDLRAVLGHARGFVFPSTLEGFGLPVLEAMAMGVPTLVADLEPMKSVAKDAALRFDPFLPQELARLMKRIILDDKLCARLRESGLAHARTMTWERVGRQTLDVYESLL